MRFLLYFDVNKTIMMSDPGASVPMPAMLNSILSECVWGRVTLGDVPTWTMASPTPSKVPTEQGTISYGEFLENVLCVSKPERKHSKTNFTEPGFVGESCRQHYLRLLERMENLPPSQLIMPSFYFLIIELERRKLDYGLVFRTFGSDCVEIVQEFNAFCSAPHKVCDNEEVVSSLLSKVVDVDKAIGKITRGGNVPDEPETYSLKMGSAVEKPLVVNGAENIYSYFISSIFDQNKRSMMIQDDYPYWHACGETDHSGKLLLVDSSTEGESIVQIFFDDNIERDRAHIVDVRKLPGLEKVPFDEANDVFYTKVAPFDIITDDSYFVTAFDNILLRRNCMSRDLTS